MDLTNDLIRLEPIRKTAVWGTEDWTVAAHPHGDCRITEGPYRGLTLSGLWQAHRELFGGFPGEEFPLMVKEINAEADLSIQVHPGTAYAAAHGEGTMGKDESWYVLQAAPGAELVLGHHAASRAEAESYVAAGTYRDLIRKAPVRAEDFIFIPAGTVHAITAGIRVLEIQQNCDITYRLYDYDRLFRGERRRLDVGKCLDVMDYSGSCPQPASCAGAAGTVTVNDSRYFRIIRAAIDGTLVIPAPEYFMTLSVTDGDGRLNGIPVSAGTHLLCLCGCPVQAEGRMTVIAAEPKREMSSTAGEG